MKWDAPHLVSEFKPIHKLQKPNRVVYAQQFVDKNPETMLATVSFSEEESGKTRVTLVWEAHGKVTPDELQTFIVARAGMASGWTGSFDKLEEYLPSHQ